ncbi:hypothetical protein ACQPXM_32750 [Kribbella sp. CA-253562]|uniref:hypothetical protein n=1 Tax=Kribbella sp. CA-253562 TaxID=3239942 RepID=UPI003D931BB6
MSLFRRPADPTELVLRRLSRKLRWFRPTLADAPTTEAQFRHLAEHRLCPAIDQGDATPVLTAFAITEEALAAADLHPNLDQALTLTLIEAVSNWCSWPETPSQVVTTIEASMGPLTRARWNAVRNQAATVADWLRAEAPSDRTDDLQAPHREVTDPELRFLTRSTRQYLDETTSVGVGDRLRFELATGQGV